MVPFEKDAFTFYEKLGSFYEKKGYSEISHSRMRRYEILLEYLQEETDVPTEVAAQKMLYDLYLREKLKKRLSLTLPPLGVIYLKCTKELKNPEGNTEKPRKTVVLNSETVKAEELKRSEEHTSELQSH